MGWLSNLLFRLLGKDLDSKLKAYFLKGSFQSIFLQAGLSLLTFLTTIVVARLTGDKGFGIYSLVFTWISIVSVAATFGLDDLAQKQMPMLKANENWSGIKGLSLWSNKMATLLSTIVVLLFAGLVNLFKIPGLYEYAIYYNWALISIPFFVYMHVNQSALRALGFLGMGQVAEKFVQPLAFLLFLWLAYWLALKVSDLEAVILRTLSFIFAALAALGLLLYQLHKYWKGLSSEYPSSTSIWRKSCTYFMLTSMLYIVNTRVDIVFLGIFEIAPEEIAYYNVALKFSDIALIPFLVVCTVATPMFSSLYHQAKHKELQLFYTKITRISFILIALVLIVFVSLGPWFLSWYGASFKQGYMVLVLLCLAKLVHVFVGPANYLLMMVGQEKAVTWALLLSVFSTILLQVLLIPRFQIEGAAYASLGGLLIFEVLVAILAYKRSGIVVTAIGKISAKRN